MLLEVPSLPTANIQADWVELSCLLGNDESISRAEMESALSQLGHDDPEPIINNIWGEIGWRKSVIPEHYPIDVHYNSIQRNRSWQDILSYSFMLLLATNSFYESTKLINKDKRTVSKLFERLATVAMKRYLMQSINIGSPREGRMPKSLYQSLQLFCDFTKETMRVKPEIRHYAKDEGVDVIAWNPVDNRPGQLIMLVQCTIEKKWYRSTEKINVDTWKNIVNFVANPCKALAFPYVCSSQWKEFSTRGGVLFDRLRLTLFFPMTSTLYLRKRIIDWCEKQKKGLRWFD